MIQAPVQPLEELARRFAASAVPAPDIGDNTMFWVGTSLSIAGVHLLIGEGELEEIMETPPLTPIPGTKPWVLGVAAYRGGLLPIISGDVLFRQQPYSGRVRDHCMVVQRPGYYFAITLSAIERDLKFPIEERVMEHAIDSDFEPFCLGGFNSRDRFLAVLDLDKLVASGVLADAAVAGIDSTEDVDDD
ncbi:MAG: chemotaxis protein CheW [Pseudomonadota bacterium]